MMKLGSACLALGLLAVASIAAREMPGNEAAAIAVAVNAFKEIYAKPDLKHYTVEVTRHGDELEITFTGERLKPRRKPNDTPPIGPSVYGPDMTYVVH